MTLWTPETEAEAEAEARAARGLWVPDEAVEKRKVYRCRTCGQSFPENQRSQWARHCVSCDRKNGEEAEEMAEGLHREAYTGILDKEKYSYLRREAARRGQLAEGQKGAPIQRTRRRR